jgi:hypothetical protein
MRPHRARARSSPRPVSPARSVDCALRAPPASALAPHPACAARFSPTAARAATMPSAAAARVRAARVYHLRSAIEASAPMRAPRGSWRLLFELSLVSAGVERCSRNAQRRSQIGTPAALTPLKAVGNTNQGSLCLADGNRPG